MADTAWEVQIQGRSSDLEHLAQHFTAPALTVSKDERDNCYLLQSSSFDSCTTSEAVLAIAEEQLAVLSGALCFVRQSDEPLCSGSVYLRHASGRRDVFVHLHGTLHGQVEIADVTVSVTDSNGVVHIKPPPPSKTLKITYLALSDASVTKALRLLTTDAKSWVGLYRLHEVVEADVGGEHEMVKLGWTSSRQLKRFKHSANSITVAGDAARHGKEKDKPPSDPMNLDEATAYVTYVLHAWFSSKGA